MASSSGSIGSFGNQKEVTIGNDGYARFVAEDVNQSDGNLELVYDPCASVGAAIAMGSDGNPVIAYGYGDSCTNSPSPVYYYTDGTTTAISGDGSIMYDVSIGPDGFARIVFQNGSYYNGESPAVNFVQCANASCTSFAANSVTVPNQGYSTFGSVGVATDATTHLQVDAGGGSFGDSSYYVLCTEVDCSSYNTQSIPAVAGDSAWTASLAMGSDEPVMIAQDTTGVVYEAQLAVSAKISQNISGTVSNDDAASSTYQAGAGTTSLGMITLFGETNIGCAGGIETVGTITPSSYTGNVIIHRTLVSQGVDENSTDQGGEPSNVDDTSPAALQDQDPQSGGSGGKVYDLDAPSIQPRDGNTYRLRDNFFVYAALSNGTRISPNYHFYVRVSCTKTSGFPGYQFVNDVPGDNKIGTGSTKTSWNLQ